MKILDQLNKSGGIIFLGGEIMAVRLIGVHVRNLHGDDVIGKTVCWYIGGDQEWIEFDRWIRRFGVSKLFQKSTRNRWRVPSASPSPITVWWMMMERR